MCGARRAARHGVASRDTRIWRFETCLTLRTTYRLINPGYPGGQSAIVQSRSRPSKRSSRMSLNCSVKSARRRPGSLYSSLRGAKIK